MGHVIDNSQCTPANCSGTPYPVTYSAYNVLGGPATATDGAGHTFNYLYNVAGRLTSLTSSLVGPNYPASLLSALHYNAFGSEVSSTIGGVALTDEREYDVRGRITAISVANPSATDSGASVTVSGTEKSSGPPTHATGTVTIQGAEDSGNFCNDAGLNCHFKYNTGSVSVTVNGTVYSTTYGSSSTPTTLASALAGTMNGSLVTATASGATITLTSVATGTSANYSLSGTSTTGDPTDFSGPSFGPITSGTSLMGGSSGSAPWDTGTVTATINGYAFSAPYGQFDTDSTVAESLANSINMNSPTALATASGSIVSLQSRDPGSTVDFTLSGSSASGNGFSPASFSVTTSGADMTGGTGSSIYSVGVSYFPNSDVEESYDSVNGSWAYTYDDFNRLNTSVSNTGLGCAEVYDRFGNRLQQNNDGGTCMTPQHTLQGNTYWIAGFTYDAAGDVIDDGIHTYQYDAEGRLASVDSGSTASYVYDAGGTRVRRTVSGVAYDEVLDLGGHVISDFLVSNGTWNRGEVYAGGMHVATYMPSTANTYFVHSDWLGTERVRSTAVGAIYSTWTSYPFGEGSAAPNPSPTHFTGKERDAESGNDYFPARYYASAMGRFMSPDWSAKIAPVPYAKLGNPQSLNLYFYVYNNPLSNVDPDGHLGCGFLWLSNCPTAPLAPPPAPPPPPALAVAGTPPSNLAAAQTAARNNPANAPTGAPGTPGRTTHCNQATCQIVEATGAPTNGLESAAGTPNLANTDARTLAASDAWGKVSPQTAQDLATLGVTVLGVAAADPHGHIVTVAPEMLSGDQNVQMNGPLINNIGGKIGVTNANNVFVTAQPTYYAPTTPQW
jgi:RHS repeat-associated protein